MKKALMLGLILVSTVTTICATEVSVRLNDVKIMFPDQQPFIGSHDRTLVPARGVFEAMGATVEWIHETRQVTVAKEDIAMTLTIDNQEIMIKETINGSQSTRAYTTDAPPIIVNDRTMIPLRVIGETLGAIVSWDGANQTVNIYDSFTQGTVVAEITTSVESISLKEGESYNVLATAIYSNGTFEDVSNKADWISTNDQKAMVSNGVIIGKSEGQVSIFCQLDGLSSKRIDVSVLGAEQPKEEPQETKEPTPTPTPTVTPTPSPSIAPVTVAALNLNSYQVNLKPGEKTLIQAEALDSNNKRSTVTNLAEWKSNDGNVVSVINGQLTALAAGTTTVECAYEGLSKQVTIKVEAPKVVSLSINKGSFAMMVDDTEEVTVSAKFSDGSSKDVTNTVTYYGYDDSALEVSSSGTIKAIKPTTGTRISLSLDDNGNKVVAANVINVSIANTAKIDGYDDTEKQPTTQPTTQPTILRVDMQAPSFTVVNGSSGTKSLSDMSGKTILLFFWTMESPYAQNMLRNINTIANSNMDDDTVEVIAVNVLRDDTQESKDTIKKHFDNNSINLEPYFDVDGTVADAYSVMGYPTTVIINSSGVVKNISARTDSLDTITTNLNNAKH